MARVRRARSVVMVFVGGQAIALDYVTQKSVSVNGGVGVALLQALEAWAEPAAVFAQLAPGFERGAAATELLRLMDVGIVVVEGTSAADADARLEQAWEWGPTAGVFHFGIRNTRYEPPENIGPWMDHRATVAPPVALHDDHAAAPSVVRLPMPPADHPLLSALRERRSRRNFADAPLPLDALRDCLFGSMAIVGFARAAGAAGAADERLPLTMTPSGGARNPYEAYVCARNVEGLEPGIYHYAGASHSLAKVGGDLPKLSELLGGQVWFERAGALIVLVATFRRTMWKYAHPGGLRVVLIEAGHIAQNILLCAAHHGIAAAPTCAVSDAALEPLLGLDPLERAVLYSVALGVPSNAPSSADFDDIADNPALPGWLGRGRRGGTTPV